MIRRMMEVDWDPFTRGLFKCLRAMYYINTLVYLYNLGMFLFVYLLDLASLTVIGGIVTRWLFLS